MKNPWTKKNPFMSMWLSGTNAVMGRVRGQATAAAKRETTAATTRGIGSVLNFWTKAATGAAASTPAAAPKAKKVATAPTAFKATPPITTTAKKTATKKTAAKKTAAFRTRKKRR